MTLKKQRFKLIFKLLYGRMEIRMNAIEAWDNFTFSDKIMFQNSCRKLLRRTFLVRDKQDDRKHYFFVANHIDIFLNYFSFMGFEIKYDKDNGVVMLDNCARAGDKDKLQSNRYRFTKEETIVLCCLWLIYEKAQLQAEF